MIVSEFGAPPPPGQTSIDARSTATPIRPGRTTVTAAGTVLAAPVEGVNTNVALTTPAGTAPDATIENVTGA